MYGIIFWGLCITFLGVGVVVLAIWARNHNRPDVMKRLLWSFCIFFACFNFPLWSERFPLEWRDIPMNLMAYSALGTGFNGIYGKGQKLFLYPRIVIFSVIGMVCRYLLEFGEVSNTYNFTIENILIYLTLVPVFIILAYEFMGRQEK